MAWKFQVADLLKGAEPPSIGIACFNVQQRDHRVLGLRVAGHLGQDPDSHQ